MLDKVKKVYYTVHVRNRQRVLNRKFASEGLTDEVLEEQVKLNALKNEHNIVLKDEKLFEDYVQ